MRSAPHSLSCPGLNRYRQRDLERRPLEYWIARLNRAMTAVVVAEGPAK